MQPSSFPTYLVKSFILLTAVLFPSLLSAQSLNASRVLFPGSIKEVSGLIPATAGGNTEKPFISRSRLTPGETAALLSIEVPLKLRNFDELQKRLAGFERISSEESKIKYLPQASDYQAVVSWLTSQGLTITQQDTSHLAVFAQGTLLQIQNAFQTKFARVTYQNQEFSSAIIAPSVPGTLAPMIVGINGLQPHLKHHKHLILKKNDLGSSNPPYLPSQIATSYHATPLYNANITGSGQTIAIVIDTFPYTSDLQNFWTTYGVNQSLSNISFIQVVGGSLPSPSGEETLDTEWSSAIAPGAKVRIYAAQTLDFTSTDQCYSQIYNDVVNTPGLNIHQMSMSFGSPEYSTSSSQLQTDAQYFAMLTSAGVTVFAATGDNGSNPDGDAISPETPACDPSVIGVGGTSLLVDAFSNPISETVWNDVEGASGGGISGYFSRPSWQAGLGVPSGTKRLVPDVACAADPETGAVVYLSGSAQIYGGTSWSCPTWAGFCALLNQNRAQNNLSPFGLLGPYLYPLLGTSNFRDIKTGNNGDYQAHIGYDLCTGIGVPDVTNLAQIFTFSAYNTGQGLADGTIDPNWTIVAKPGAGTSSAYVTNELIGPFPAWLPDSGNSKWISPTAVERSVDSTISVCTAAY